MKKHPEGLGVSEGVVFGWGQHVEEATLREGVGVHTGGGASGRAEPASAVPVCGEHSCHCPIWGEGKLQIWRRG